MMKRITKSIMAVALILVLTACSGRALKSQTDDDSIISTKVKSALFQEKSLRDSQIHVSTRNRVVQLSGAVEGAPDAGTAAIIAGAVPGVTAVENLLVVKD